MSRVRHAPDDAGNEPGEAWRRALHNVILQVPVPFFFEGAPHVPGQRKGTGEAPSPAYVSEFLATADGLALTKAFMRIEDVKLRRRIVHLVEEIAGDDDR